MTYYIIGGDQQEYGPVPSATLRQWIADSRANAQTQARAEGEATWQPLGAIPEFAGLLGGGTPPPPLPAGGTAACAECGKTFPTGDLVRHGQYFVCAACKPVFMQKLAEGAVLAPAGPARASATIEEILARDFQLDIGQCFSRAWIIFKANLWPVVGVTAAVIIPSAIISQAITMAFQAAFAVTADPSASREVGFIIANLGVNVLASFVGTAVNTLFLGGLYYYYLKLVRGEPAGLETAFSGFTRVPVSLFIAGCVRYLLIILGMTLLLLPGIFLAISWIFTELLVMDRRLGPWEALMVGIKVVSKHWFLIFALTILTGILSGAGLIACCVGVLFTVPIAFLTCAQAYQDIFGDPPV